MSPQISPTLDVARAAARPHVEHALDRLPTTLQGPPSFDAAFAAARRVELDAHSWIDVVPGWVQGDETLMIDLLRTAGWEQRERRMFDQTFTEPRLTAEHRVLADAPLPFLGELAAALSERYGVEYDGLWMNFYRGNSDSAGWHADRPANRPEEAVVPVLSLGAQRRFLIKHNDGGESTRFEPAGGDLLVMGGRAQRDYKHMVPKQKTPAGPRISLNFTSRKQWEDA